MNPVINAKSQMITQVIVHAKAIKLATQHHTVNIIQADRKLPS